MIFTLAWLAASLLFSLIFWNRPAVVLCAVVLARIAIPGIAEGLLTSGLHPAFHLFVVHLAVQCVFAWPRVRRAVSGMGLLLPGIMLVLVAWMLTDALNRSGGGALGSVLVALKIVVLPFFLLAFIRDEVVVRPRSERLFIWTILGSAIAEVVLCIQQVALGRAILWEGLLSNIWFLDATVLSRAVGTLGHGIQVGVLMAVACAVCLRLKSVILKVSLPLLFAYAALLAQARLGLVLVAVGYVLVLVSTLARRPVSLIVWSIPGLLAALWVFNSEAGQEVRRKFVDDGSSTELRLAAYQWVSKNFESFLWTGYPGARNLREGGYLGSSLENGYFIFAVNFGVACAVLLLVLQVGLLIQPALRGAYRLRSFPYTLGALVLLISSAGSSAFMSQAIDGPLFWVLAALAWCSPAVAAAEGVTTASESSSSESEMPGLKAHP